MRNWSKKQVQGGGEGRQEARALGVLQNLLAVEGTQLQWLHFSAHTAQWIQGPSLLSLHDGIVSVLKGLKYL